MNKKASPNEKHIFPGNNEVLASLFAENESLVPAAEFPKRERGELGELDEILRRELC